MASEKAQHPWSRAEQEADEDTPPLSINTPLSEVQSIDEQPPAYSGSSENAESSAGNGKQPFLPPPPVPSQSQSSSSNLQKPVAIPAVDSSPNSPFLRAYAPILKDYNLPQEAFLNFLDRLNKAVATSPSLQVLDVTGGLLNSVPVLFPLHWIGSAVSGLANLGNIGVSKSRTDSLLKEANRNIFGPRGLKIEVARLDALAHIAKIPILDSQGKVSRQAALFQQLAAIPGPASVSSNNSGSPAADAAAGDAGDGNNAEENFVDVQQSRVRILQPWIADLELQILPWTSKSKLTRFNVALKKYNTRDPRGQQQQQQQQQYQQRNGQDLKQGPSNAAVSGEEEDDPFRKCLWLIIREV